MCWRHAEDEYAAIHFHDDDIVDCRAGRRRTNGRLPSNLKSGSMPWFSKPVRRGKTFLLCRAARRQAAPQKSSFLMSTFTYVIYQNNARLEWLTRSRLAPNLQALSKAWNGYPNYPGEHPEFGWSTITTTRIKPASVLHLGIARC